MWSSALASEKCIWALEKWLIAQSQTASDPEKDSILATIKEIYTSQYKRHLEMLHTTIPRWIIPFLCISLVVGILCTVVGYVGCFYLIQHASSSSLGPLLWLILEALLSILRILVWVINPSWDDSKGVVFELQLASHAPLVTCNKFEDDIKYDSVSPVARAKGFLEEVVAYTGPLPLFNTPNFDVFYILTAQGKSPSPTADTLPHGKLYIIIHDYREQKSRVLFKEDDQSSFSIYTSVIEPDHASTTINVRAKLSGEGITEGRTYFFTSDIDFMDELTAHYDGIILRFQRRKMNMERKAFFGKTWAMQPPEDGEDTDDYATQSLELGPEEHWGLLTDEDMAYLRQGQVERRWREMHSRLEEWTDLYISLYTTELLEDVPVDLVFKANESVKIVQKYEANEVEYLLIECRTYLERLLTATAAKWNDLVGMDYGSMVEDIIQGTFTDTVSLNHSDSDKQYGEEIRKSKLRRRLFEERLTLFDKETRSHRDSMRSRLTAQADSTEQRMKRRKYHDPESETIVNVWRSLEGEINPGPPKQLTASNGAILKPEGHSIESYENSIAARRDAFMVKMQARFGGGNKDVENFTDAIDRKNEYDKFELMKARCHQRVDQLFSRMEDQTKEFEELHTNDVLTAQSHELVDYWRSESLEERRRLLDRTQRFLELSGDSIEAVGGHQNMARALMRSQDFSYVDFSRTRFTAEAVISIVKGVKSITGVSSYLGPEANKKIFETVKANVNSVVAANQDVCFYGDAYATDHYRKGQPYLLFRGSGGVCCIVLFYTHGKCDHILTLRHCMTTSNAKVEMSLNNHPLEGNWGQSQAVRHNFANEDIHLPEAYLMDVGQPNVLTIVLAEDSPGAYWVSDVFLPVQPILGASTVTAS